MRTIVQFCSSDKQSLEIVTENVSENVDFPVSEKKYVGVFIFYYSPV